jgi:anti-sigma B factor antagonist
VSVRITIVEIDAATAEAFRAEVGQAVAAAASDGGRAVLDFSDVTFIDSTGLSVLVDVLRTQSDVQLTVVNAQPHVQRVFHLTGLDLALGSASN